VNRSGLTLSAAAATLVSLPAAAMLLSLSGTGIAHAGTTPAAQAPVAAVPVAAVPTANCNCSQVYDAGADHSVTALSSTGNGNVAYAAWTANGGDHGPGAPSGIATNYGGRWHQVSTEGLPKLSITGITVDSSNAAHAYAVYGEHSRQDIRGGLVFETRNGGRDWDDISGNLPDLASIISLVLNDGRLALATNEGIFTALESGGAHTCWQHLGSVGPNITLDDLTVGAEDYLYAAWVAGRGDHGAPSGIATDFGGRWHQIGTEGLPKQYISGITVDSSNAAHAYAVFNEHSRQDIRGRHVFETWNGGRNWVDISGNLPGLASIVRLVLDHGRLALATSVGVFTAFEFRGEHTSWLHLGSFRQHVPVYALTVGPHNCLYAATHGHGIWRFML
jgi:hypothetical protein